VEHDEAHAQVSTLCSGDAPAWDKENGESGCMHGMACV